MMNLSFRLILNYKIIKRLIELVYVYMQIIEANFIQSSLVHNLILTRQSLPCEYPCISIFVGIKQLKRNCNLQND